MRRREFIAFAGSAVAWPVAASAQQAAPKRLVGLVTGLSEPELKPLLAVFSARLRDLGWNVGATITIDARASGGDFERMSADAASLVTAKADVVVAMGTPALNALRQHSRTVSTVFLLVADPVGQGLINSLSRPGGNATGLTNFEFSIGGKWIELLKELDPTIRRVTLLTNPANANTKPFVDAISTEAQKNKVEIVVSSVRNREEIQSAIKSAAAKPGGSLVIFPDSLPLLHRELIVGESLRLKIPAMFPFRIFATSGGLVSYGLNISEVFHQTAEYTDKILRGISPAELPVQAPNKFELVINLRTAKSLGLNISPTFIARADEVIE